jgi:hypothetical protein
MSQRVGALLYEFAIRRNDFMTWEIYDNAMTRRSAVNDATANQHPGLNGGEILLAQANCGWRACYGVSPNMGQLLQQRNDQIQSDMLNARPQGRWRPDPRKLRDWSDQFDDPEMNRTLNGLRQNGVPRVFGPPRPYDGYPQRQPYGNQQSRPDYGYRW